MEGLKGERVNRVVEAAHPLEALPRGHKPDVVQAEDGIKEPLESLEIVRLGEPCRVIKEAEGCPAEELICVVGYYVNKLLAVPRLLVL